LLDVEIIEFPNPVASFSVDNAIGCLGTPINFTDNSTITAPSTIATYQWNFGNGIITPASSGAVIAVPNTIGTYTALSHDYAANGAFVPQLTVVSSDGCSDVFNLPISINALPVVVAGVDQTICSGDQVTLNGAGALTYSWNNGVTNGIAFTPVVGTVIYTVTGTNINGCENSDQVQVVVNPLPIVGAGVNQVVCSGDQVTIAGSGASTYTWDNGITNGVAFFPAVGTVVYTVTGTDLNGCENTDQVQVIVNPLPLVVAGIDQTVCSGDQVTLNGAGASTYSWDNGIINGVAFIPAVGSVVYTVTGTDLNGCENTDQVQVTVNALPIVGAGLDQTVCSGDQVNLNGSGATVYTWDNGVIDGVAFTPAVGTIIYTVTGTDLNGCENTDQVQVVVNALPIVGAGLNQSVCIGDQVTLIGTGASTYTWDNGVNNNVAFVPAVGTVIYTVVGTDVNGCENTDQVEVIVNALPIVDAGLDKIVCQGTQVTLSGSGANTYSWNPFANDGVAFVQAVGTVIYTVTGTDLNGCVNTDQVQVTVNPLPIVTAGPDQVVCAGTSVTLAAVGAITYTWNNGVINGIAFNPVSGTLVYTVIGTNAFSCENFDQVQVIVNPNPNTVASPDQTICNGTSITLVGAGATNYAWDNGVINGVPFTPVLGTTVYTVIGSFITGCHSLDSVTITVNPKPIVTTFNAEICKGESVVLKGFGADTYAWTGGVIDNVAFYPMATENYFVTGTNLFNCSSSAMAKVVVHDLPIASFYMTNEHFTTTSSSSMFMNTSFDAVSYSWNFNDGSPISAEESPYHEFIADAEMEFTVQLVATTSFGCVDTAIRVIEIKEELLFYVPNTFTPDGDNLNNTFQPVFVNGFDPQGYTLYIFNRWGQIVFESHDTNFGWNGRYGVDGDFAQDGTYSWKIEVKDEHSANREMFIGHVNILR
jgi:gliding motility-associated-like protein